MASCRHHGGPLMPLPQHPERRGPGCPTARDGPAVATSAKSLQAAVMSRLFCGLGGAASPSLHPSAPQRHCVAHPPSQPHAPHPAPPTPFSSPAPTPKKTPSRPLLCPLLPPPLVTGTPPPHMLVISSLLCTYDSVPDTMVPAMSTPSSGWMTTPQMDSHASRRTSLWDA